MKSTAIDAMTNTDIPSPETDNETPEIPTETPEEIEEPQPESELLPEIPKVREPESDPKIKQSTESVS